MEVLLVLLGILSGGGIVYFLLYMLKSLVEPTIIRRKGEEGYIVVHGNRITLVLPKPKPGMRNPFLDEDGNLLTGTTQRPRESGMHQETDKLEASLDANGSRVPLPGPIPPKPDNPLLTESALLPRYMKKRKGH